MVLLLDAGPALREVARVLGFGAQKYSKHGWRESMDAPGGDQVEWGRNVSAALRHLEAWYQGETYDPESGINHLAHAICDLMFVLTYQVLGKGKDDRYGS